MSIDLNGKVAIITGAARGLGLLVARDLAREGMTVVGTDTRGQELQCEMAAIAAEALAQDMLARGEGTLIFVSSGSGKKGEEDSAPYCASKWGVIGFAESVAKDLKKTRIRVTVITPGMIQTPMARESEAGRRHNHPRVPGLSSGADLRGSRGSYPNPPLSAPTSCWPQPMAVNE